MNRLQERQSQSRIPTEGVAAAPLTVAVPSFDSLSPHGGLGRVIKSLAGCWGDRVRIVPAQYESLPLPVLRNNPYAVRATEAADLVLLPQLTGAQALRHTSGTPSVVIVHDVGIVDFAGDLDGMDWLTRVSIQRNMAGLRHAALVVAVSDFTRDRLIHHVPELSTRVCTIHDGVGDLFLDFGAPRRESIEVLTRVTGRRPGHPVLTYVGSEHPRKNIAVLLAAFRRLKESIPDAQLIKVGEAGDPRWRDATLRACRDLDLDPGCDILFLEGLEDETLAHVYRAADVFVTASLYEGFGLPALEAMAVGTPVVVTDRGALPEVVGDAGWVVAADAESLANGARQAVDGLDRDERVRRGKTRARSLSWSSAGERYLEVMDSLVRRS